MIPEIKKPTANNIISFVTGLLILLIAIGSFALSYNNLHQTALAHGVGPNLAYIWPLLIDFALVVFSLAVVQSNLNNEPALMRWLMVALYTIATVAFNVYHAPTNLAAQIVAVVAPVTLFLSFETLMAMLKNGVIKRNLVASLSQLKIEWGNLETEYSQRVGQLQEQIETMERAIQSYQSDIEARQKELKNLDSSSQIKAYIPANLTAEQRQELVNRMGQDGLTQGQMAETLGVSTGTIKNIKKANEVAINGRVN